MTPLCSSRARFWMPRYLACRACGRVPITVDLKAGIDPIAFVKSRNLHRRHLTGSQRAAAEVRCGEWATAGNQPNMEPGSTLAGMAKAADVSIKTIQHAKAAHSAGLGEAVRDGKITAKAAAVFGRTPKAWIDGEGSRLIELCTLFNVALQLVWDTRCVMAINAELGMKLWRGEMETEEAKAIVINDDLELARRVWSGELALSLYEFEAMREAAAKDTAWITAAVASKLVTQTLLHD